MLETGVPAPDLRATDTAGATFSLADRRGVAPVLIYFARSTGCPVCAAHVRDLARRQGEFAGVEVVVAVPEDQAAARAWRERHALPFTVLTGDDGAAHASIGLRRTMFGSMQQSGTVLVDAAGVVRYVRTATLPTGGYDRRETTEAVAALTR
ncbi:peroxiredoxin family protein [Nocardia thailandica]|uniref:thioredoxin-dependent peroxiredoxin n=1 Tax=Nocardia thailandica TaxID=257275 RepID=A0ABW6PY06_9NOCA